LERIFNNIFLPCFLICRKFKSFFSFGHLVQPVGGVSKKLETSRNAECFSEKTKPPPVEAGGFRFVSYGLKSLRSRRNVSRLRLLEILAKRQGFIWKLKRTFIKPDGLVE